MSACAAIPNTDLSISNSPKSVEWYPQTEGESVLCHAPQNVRHLTGCGGSERPLRASGGVGFVQNSASGLQDTLNHRIEISEAA